MRIEVQPGDLEATAGDTSVIANSLFETAGNLDATLRRAMAEVGDTATADAIDDFRMACLDAVVRSGASTEELAGTLCAAAVEYDLTDRGIAGGFNP